MKETLQSNVQWKYGDLEGLLKELREYYKWFDSLSDSELNSPSSGDKKDPITMVKNYVDSLTPPPKGNKDGGENEIQKVKIPQR